MSLIMITGGARSGKSTFAEEKVLEIGRQISYIATAKVTDKDMEDRIEKHKHSRPSEWHTFEMYNNFQEIKSHKAFEKTDTFLLDCITIMVTNIMFDETIDYDTCSSEAISEVEKKIFVEIDQLINTMKENQKQLVAVTNEVGFGIVPAYRLGSIFRDIAGRVNQYLAKQADEVYLVVSAIPMKIK
ncbi:adenosylcobinamide kinase /adenosylcobinamide-phosphate guanylyltransferase [Natranaerovirga pectinivora]|uniref:Adenosylcobinamide kinase n=1 Tax=Natranaerovirga pectinivora TaxID=682400 RepID=A0A4V2V0D5_9FIRM|nr:bifunctional adenosylcobinamide kinase/adenosylcobinamide-phosphate guanylyltransferase [Natranaerovirga pectinivora]TCT15520.1 adenosylcobinamide kinase /adenosylcobinamide-phosphate guanylyltransferase [Natranaerovirga pectinivora]